MRDYHKRMTIRLTTDFSAAPMDASRLDNHIFQVLRTITLDQESHTPLNWSEIKNWGEKKGAQGRICGEKAAFIRSGVGLQNESWVVGQSGQAGQSGLLEGDFILDGHLG